MKKLVVFFVAILCCGMIFGGCNQQEETTESAADTVFENGYVFTADEEGTVAECVAIKDGEIIFVGTNADGEAYKGENTEVVDMTGQMLIPGMMDSHIHVPSTLTQEMYQINLSGVTGVEETIEIIEEFIASHPDLDVYYGEGYNTTAFTTGDELTKGPSKERLDAIESEKPIIIRSYDCHSKWVNSAALEMFNITADTELASDGTITIDEETGEPWGTLNEGAMDLVPEMELTNEETMAAMYAFVERMNSFGYTSICAVSAWDGNYWDEFAQMEEAGDLTLKVKSTYTIDPAKDLTEQFDDLEATKAKYDSNMLELTTAKFFADGTLDALTAYMKEPYDIDPSTQGDLLWDPDELAEAFTMANERGLQIHMHCIGDAAVSAGLDALEYAAENAPEGDCRNTLTHLIYMDEADISRFKDLDVIASFQPYWIVKFPGYWDVVEEPFIGERAENSYLLKSCLDAGVLITSSSDSPVTPWPDPLIAIEAGVTRNITDGYVGSGYEISNMDDSPEYILGKEERVSVEDMIKSFTINNAYMLFCDDVTGSIEVGKCADLVVLDQNIIEMNPVDIETAKVVRTYLDGQIVYDANE